MFTNDIRPLDRAQVYFNGQCRCYYIKGWDDEGIFRNRPATKSEETVYYGEIFARREQRNGSTKSFKDLVNLYAHYSGIGEVA